MTPLRTLASRFVLGLVLPSIALAQSDSRRWPPAVVVDSFLTATRDARWLDAARFMDLDAIAAMRDQSVRAARRQRPPSRITPEMILEREPKMPREVAEYQARRANDLSPGYDALAYEYAGVPSVDGLACLPRADVAARWLEAQDPRWGMRRGLLERTRSRRGRSPSPIMIPPSVTMLRRIDSAWRIIPAYEPGGGSAFVPVADCPPS